MATNYRDRLASAALGSLRARRHFNYEQRRPVDYAKFNEILNAQGGTMNTDCSGLATCCFYRVGIVDPNGKNYDGEAYTGYLLHGTLPVKNRNKLKRGDLCVFGAYPGDHVVIAVEDGWNPLCVSHGKQGDPSMERLDYYLGLGPLTVLNARPNMLHRRKQKKVAKWIVTGDGGHVVSHVYSTRFGWYCKHLPLARKQGDQLHFDRIKDHPKGVSNPPVLEEVK